MTAPHQLVIPLLDNFVLSASILSIICTILWLCENQMTDIRHPTKGSNFKYSLQNKTRNKHCIH